MQGKNRVIVLALSLFFALSLCVGAAGEAPRYQVDVVVIGAGGAGMTAAIEALDAGASVIILEKMSMVGGNTVRASGGLNAAGSASQKAAGIEDSPEVMIQDTMKGGKEKNDPALVRYLAEHSAAAIDWLIAIGLDVSEVAQGAGATNARMHRGKGGAIIGSSLVQVLRENLEKRGVKVLLNAQATELIQEDGAVKGLKALYHGVPIEVRSNAVVIATGGFGANEEMFVKYRPDLAGFKTTNHKGATGDGIVMAEAVGAATVDMSEIQTNPTVEVSSTTVISESVRGKGAIMVNQEGARFVSEMQTRDVLSSAILQQTDKIAYLILDQRVMDSMKALQDNYAQGIITKGDSIETLAQTLNIDAAQLAETLATWNKAVADKKDTAFERATGMDEDLSQAPYYAIKVSPAVHHTMGGIKINPETQVVSTQGEVINGLYAAGEVTGGLHGANRLGGNAVADIEVFGRQAGQQSAAFALGMGKLEAVLPAQEEAGEAQPDVQGNFKDGEYLGEGKGNNGILQVKVTVKDGSIVSVEMVKNPETAGIFAAVEEVLIPNIIKTQRLDLDVISGATNSSNAVLEAIKAAIGK